MASIVKTMALMLMPGLFGLAACNPAPAPSASALRAGSAAPVRDVGEPAEMARYEVQGDTVMVNNTICAYSRSPIGTELLGQYQSRVRYEGPIAAFRGKTLVFNQCCPMCVDAFGEKWEAERDQIMKFHGLI